MSDHEEREENGSMNGDGDTFHEVDNDSNNDEPDSPRRRSRDRDVGRDGDASSSRDRHKRGSRDRNGGGSSSYRDDDDRNVGRGGRGRSRSPQSDRKRHQGDREEPPPGKCIGVFGLNINTKEPKIRSVFERFGPIENIQVVYDAQTGRSRGFCFVYYERDGHAEEAKNKCNGIEIDGRCIRVDFSITQRAHTPTPGVYMGRGQSRGGGGGGRTRGFIPREDRNERRHYDDRRPRENPRDFDRERRHRGPREDPYVRSRDYSFPSRDEPYSAGRPSHYEDFPRSRDPYIRRRSPSPRGYGAPRDGGYTRGRSRSISPRRDRLQRYPY